MNPFGILEETFKLVEATVDVIMEVDKHIDEIVAKMEKTGRFLGGRWADMNDIAFKTARNMGMAREEAEKYQKNLTKYTMEFGATFALNAQQIADFQKQYKETTGRNVELTKNQIKDIAVLRDMTDDATAIQLVDEFDKIGLGTQQATAHMFLMRDAAKSMGVSAAKATKIMKDNIQLASKYSFRNGVEDIKKMSIAAASMRVDMNAVMSAAEKFMDIEDAISTSANIQMLGGTFAQQFSNPMAAMYEANADPKAFMDRLLESVKGKATYNAETGGVEFDPVTMRTMREVAKQLGISVEKLTEPAIAETKDNAIEAQLGISKNRFNDEELAAIKNLSRGNFDAETGKYKVSWRNENGEIKTKNIEDLTTEELAIARENQMTEENMQLDVRKIRETLDEAYGRTKDTKSYLEKYEGTTKDTAGAFMSLIQGLWMNPFAKLGNSTFNFIGETLGDWFGSKYEQGGIVGPVQHADFGTIISGKYRTGDRTPILANAGEMILNPREQKAMFESLKRLSNFDLNGFNKNELDSQIGLKDIGSVISSQLLKPLMDSIRPRIEEPTLKTPIEALQERQKEMAIESPSIKLLGNVSLGNEAIGSLSRQFGRVNGGITSAKIKTPTIASSDTDGGGLMSPMESMYAAMDSPVFNERVRETLKTNTVTSSFSGIKNFINNFTNNRDNIDNSSITNSSLKQQYDIANLASPLKPTASSINGTSFDPISMGQIRETAKILGTPVETLVSGAIEPQHVKPIANGDNFMRVSPRSEEVSKEKGSISLEGTSLSLNVSGTIKLDAGDRSVGIDANKLIDNPTVLRQITDTIVRQINIMSNGGKYNAESSRNNMANTYNRSGS